MRHLYKNNFSIGAASAFLAVLVFLASIFICNLGAKNSKADTQNVSLTATTESSMSFTTSAGSTVAFGTVTAGSPVDRPATGTVLTVTTNAVNGYTLGISDSIAGSDSALSTAGNYIPDYAGTIATPTLWSGTGLGVTLYAADNNKEVKWGTGSAYNDGTNKYAGVPQNATTAHTVTGYHAGADTSSWAFRLNVAPGQYAGNYTGTVTFTATAVLI